MKWIFVFAAALAAPASAFTQEDVLRAEVLPGWRGSNGQHMAALSLSLAPGWKTYWRSPGEAGIPPVLDFAGSGNLAAVRLHWPSPQVFEVGGLQTLGYHDQLILPIEVTPTNAGQPVDIALTVNLGVCRDICVPAYLELSAHLAPQLAPASTSDPLILAALDRAPGRATEAGLTAIHCAVEPIADGLTVTTRITMPRIGAGETVVIEPADETIWVSRSETSRDGGNLIATTDLVPPSGAPFALARSTLRVTVISQLGAVEIMGCPAP